MIQILFIISASQFHYGSIKTQFKLSIKGKSHKSQFHYGSIKTLAFEGRVNKTRPSQFHYGSIKTIMRISYIKDQVCLNSTMVRLKQERVHIMSRYEWCLNSTMVRLKLRSKYNLCTNRLSQFHYGSIKTF